MLTLFLSSAILWPKRRHGHWALWIVSLLNLTFFVALGIALASADFLLFFKTVPVGLQAIMTLPWISAVTTLPLPVFAWRIVKDDSLRSGWKVHYMAVTMAAFTFVWYAGYWNVMLGV